ncbi:MAG TPA: hypothetical protein VFI17_11200 [Solirubrobacterales bacterium]|nr:hypothetical protein [Solirubrobacterales bacterium]
MSVLGKAIIEEREQELFPWGSNPENVLDAKYYLTLGEHFLILPTGKRFGEERARKRAIIIEPGQTAYVSTAEHVAMPDDLIGVISPRFTGTELGILFFGGLLVDPGYGRDDEIGEAAGEPLSFHIANVGRNSLALRPGDPIASLAFLTIKNAEGNGVTPGDKKAERSRKKPIELREELFAGKREKPSGALGLVEDLRQIQKQVDKLQAAVKTVVLFGVVVLAATLFAAVIAAVFSFAGNNDGAKISDEAWSSLGKALGMVVGGTFAAFALIWLVISLASWLMEKRRRQSLDI